jgi:hypothetical protein
MLGYNNTTADQVINCLLNSANPDIYQVQGNIAGTLGSGRLDAFEALRCLTTNCGNQGNNISKAFIYADRNTICTNGSVTLTANQGITYQWSNKATTQSTTINTTGDYSVTVTFNGGCTSVAKIKITQASPIAQLLITENSGHTPNDGLLCNADPLNLSVTWGLAYKWSYLGNTSQTIPGYINAGNQIPFFWSFSVTVTSVNGCIGVNQVLSGKASWLPSPISTITITENSQTPNDGTICAGAPVTLTAPLATGLTYLWSNGATSNTIIISPLQTTTYNVTITNVNGCSSIGQKIITVAPSPNGALTVIENSQIPNDGTICAGAPTTLSVPLALGLTYLWSNGAVTNTISVSPNNSTTYSVTITNSIGCSTISSQIVTVTPVLSANFTYTVNCPGQIIATIPSSTLTANHLWTLTNTSGLIVASSSGTSFTSVNLPNDIYTLTHSIDNSCGVTTITQSIVVECVVPIECACPNPAYNLAPMNGQPNILLSTTSLYNDHPLTFSNLNGCMTIYGKLIIDKDYNFNLGEIIMQPGSEIEVQQGIKLTITNVFLHSCNRLWRGIYVSNGADIKVYESRIEDAQYGIRCRGNNSGNISNTNFNRNYVGFYADAFPVQGQNVVNVILSNNEFQCTAPLLPNFNNTSNLGTVTYSGILANFAAFEIGMFNLANSKNDFHNIQNAIITYESVGDMHFPNIFNLVKNAPLVGNDLFTTPTPLTTGGLNHFGMYLDGSNWNVHNARITQVNSNIITKGIHLFRSRGFWMDNSNINTVAGLYNISSRSHLLIQRNNIFTNTDFGIRNFNSAGTLTAIGFEGATALNQRNTFTGSAPLIPSSRGIAIDITGFTSTSTASNKGILSNIISISTNYDGINLNRDGNYLVANNVITFTNTGTDGRGIVLQGTPNHRIWGNNINANTPIFGTAVLMSGASTNNIFCCNQTNNTTDGISFNGTMAAGTILRNTIFNTHDRGLRLTTGTIIGPQIHAGNRFVGPFANNSAIFSGNPDIGLRNSSRFEVRPLQGTTTFPNAIIPNSGWFIPTIGITPACGSDALCQPAPLNKFTGGNVEIPELVLTIAQQSFLDAPYGSSNQWEGGRWVLQEIEKNPEWLGINESLDKFYESAKKSNLQEFNDIDKLLGALETPNEEQQVILNEVFDNSSILRKQIEYADTQLGAKQEKADSVKSMELRGEYLERLYYEFTRSNAIYENIQKQKNERINAIFAINKSINPENIFEKNEQRVNEIYLNSLAIDKYELTDTEQDEIHTLSHLCFREAGSAVHKARVLYNLFALPDFDDKKCEKESKEIPFYNKVVKSNGSQTVKIYPNPVSENITFEVAANGEFTVLFRDVNGKIVKQLIGNKRITTPTIGIPNGIIFCEIYIDNNKIDTQRIIIIH